MATLKEALQYAAQNPTSDFANQLKAHIQSGASDAEAQQLGIDLTPIKQATPTEPKKPSLTSRVLGGLKQLGTGAAQSLLGTAIGTARVAQSTGQNVLAGLTGTPLEQIKSTTGFKSVDASTPEGQAVNKALTPQTGLEQVGKTGTDIAQFFVPSSSISKARTAVQTLKGEKLASTLSNLGLGEKAVKAVVAGGKLALESLIEGGASAGITAAQTGEVGKEAATSGVIAGAFPVIGKGFNLLKENVAPSVLSFTSGVPQKAIQEAQKGGSAIGTGIKSSVEDIQKNASQLLNDPKTGLYKQLSDEFSKGLDAVTAEYKTGLQQSAKEAAQSFKANTIAQLQARGANEAAQRLEASFNPENITAISQIKSQAENALGNLKNFPLVDEAVSNWTKSAKQIYDFSKGSDDLLKAQNALKDAVTSNLRKFKIGVKAGEPVFDKSAIVKTAEQNNIKQVVDTIKTWKDFSPEGTQALMARLSKLSKFDAPLGEQTSAVLGSIYNDTKEKLVKQFYPKLAEIRTSFDTTKGILDTIDEVVGGSTKKTEPKQIQAAVSRLTNLFKEDKQTYLDAVRELSNRSGVDILGMLAGTEFKKVLPDFVRGIGGGATVGIGASVLNPYLLLLAPLFSPRGIKTVVSPSATTKAIGKGATELIKKTTQALPSILK